MQSIGAVSIKNAVYALPNNEQTQEDFAWVHKEIIEGGGEAVICDARLVDGLSDIEIKALFNSAREADYRELIQDARTLLEQTQGLQAADRQTELKAQFTRLKTRLARIVEIDFFGADGREAADGMLGGIQAKLMESVMKTETTPVEPAVNSRTLDLVGRVWVTRQGIKVDRIASAWLIRRFIDKDAAFKFVPGKNYVPSPNELRFDMFDAEYTHEGDRCTFEVLLTRAGLEDSALQAIAEIVHDIDLKDGKFGREEAGGVKMLIAGLANSHEADEDRLTAGCTLFDNLYASFSKKRPETKR